MRSLLLFFMVFSFFAEAKTVAVYLAWYTDPTTTMTVHWHSPKGQREDTVFFEEVHSVYKNGNWDSCASSHSELNYLTIHTAHLNRLKPNTEYRFRIGKNGKIHTFKTAPISLEKGMRFIVGGDLAQTTSLFHKMNQTVASLDPLFCVLGGDIAYAVNASVLETPGLAFNRWIHFFSTWSKEMQTKEGRLIPMVVCVGNHDISPKEEQEELFFHFFPLPNKTTYQAIDFGNYLSLILLDTGHYKAIEGKQTRWLASTLALRENVPFCFAVYHEAAYPSYYPFESETPQKIRASWCPLFERYAITAAFENHNHTFKRTYPILNGNVSGQGIVYLGDGSWGARPRAPQDAWYLAASKKENSVYVVDLTEKEASIQAIDIKGEPIDQKIPFPAKHFSPQKTAVMSIELQSEESLSDAG